MINYLKTRLRASVRETVLKVNRLQTAPYGDSFWYEQPNLWEPPVQLALRDLCRSGAIVYDVGANFGGLTAVMSRLVGPRGVVVSFEASPRIIGHLQANIVKQGWGNVYLQHRAVYSRSGATVEIYPGDHLNDSIYKENSPAGTSTAAAMRVKTVALDDFVEATKLVPALVKMDIEGAEFDALQGASKLLEAHRPHLLLEQQANDARCIDFVRARGYKCFDLNNYREIKSPEDYPAGVGLRNLLAIHAAVVDATPYKLPFKIESVTTVDRAQFIEKAEGVIYSQPLRLGPGRYLAEVSFQATGTNNEMWCGVEIDSSTVFRYHAYTKLLADSYRDWVFDVDADGDVSFFFRFLNGTTDPSFNIQHITVQRLVDFASPRLPPLVLD